MISHISVFGLIFVGFLQPLFAEETCFPASALSSYVSLRKVAKKPCLDQWIKTRNDATAQMLDKTGMIEPIRQRLAELKTTNPGTRIDIGHGEIFLSGGDLIYAPDGQPEQKLIQGASLPAGQVLSEFRLSPDAQKILFALNTGGADFSYWQIYDFTNRIVLNDEPIRIRYGTLSWDSVSKGVFYNVWPDQAVEEHWVDTNARRNIPVAYHLAGTKRSEDRILFQDPQVQVSMGYGMADAPGGNLLAYRSFHPGVPMALYAGEKKGKSYRWKQIQAASDQNRTGGLIGRLGDELIFKSAECGNNFCLIAISLTAPFQRRVLIPYSKTHVLAGAQIVGPYIHAQYFDTQFKFSLQTFALDGRRLQTFRPEDFGLPALGSLSGVSGHVLSRKGYFTFSAMDVPTVTFRYNLKTLKIERLPSLKPHPFEKGIPVKTELRYYRSFDGKLIPIHVYTRTDLKEKPKFALMFYYGAIGATYFSSFSAKWILALEMGGMVAVPNIRGGGEGGHQWFLDGAKDKMATIKDIGWASRWLKKNYEIQNNSVIAEGGSWGGLHTYMALQHFPDDFTAFISDVPVASVGYAYQGLFGWLLPDDLAPKRNALGNFVNFPRELKKIQEWSALENVPRMKKMKPIISIFNRNDERAGPEQGPFMMRALEHQFGPQAPSYAITRPTGGHSVTPVIPEAMAFISHITGAKELIPLDRRN